MKGKELVRILKKNGWYLKRVSGSHHIMAKGSRRTVAVPVHANRDVPKGTASAILRQAGIKKG
jgi:predicted RNA binding protein YcfA (HicA-like mRNA interferase family)